MKINILQVAMALYCMIMISCSKENEKVQLQIQDDFSLSHEATQNSIAISWEAVSNATSYTIELSDASGKVMYVFQTQETSYTFAGLNSGAVYQFRLKANQRNTALDSDYTQPYTISTKLAAPTLMISESDFDFLTFTWASINSATSYDLQLLNAENELLKEGSTTGNEYTFGALEAGKTYYARIRASKASATSDFSEPFKAITSTSAKVHGLPVSWVFAERNTLKDYAGNAMDPARLQAVQPQWVTSYTMKPELLAGFGDQATLTAVNVSGKMNGFAYNNGHPYLRGMMKDDYWLFTVPVKGLKAGRELTLSTGVTGSGSGPGPFIVEWSADNNNWTAVSAVTESIMNGANPVNVTYTYWQGDNLNNANGQPISYDIPITQDINEGNVYIRLRVSADIRVSKNGSAIAETGSSRLMGRTMIVVK